MEKHETHETAWKSMKIMKKHKSMENHEKHGKAWKSMKKHGKAWKSMGTYDPMENTKKTIACCLFGVSRAPGGLQDSKKHAKHVKTSVKHAI